MPFHPALKPKVRDHVIASALCVFIPLPILDDIAARQCMSAAVRALATHHAIELPKAAVHALTEDRRHVLVGCLLAVVWWPIKKLFRTFFFFLTVKDVIDTLAVVSHRLDLIDAAMAARLLPDHAVKVRVEIDAVLARHRTSPVMRALFGYERPDLPHPTPEDALGRALHHNARFGGGALVRADFLTRMDTFK